MSADELRSKLMSMISRYQSENWNEGNPLVQLLDNGIIDWRWQGKVYAITVTEEK